MYLFRKILLKLFIWRLKIARPDVIYLDMDASVLNNDDARKRHGVGQTYKKVWGFAPLFITWGPFIIDAIFRGGIRHSNHANTAANAVTHIVNLIRRECRHDVVIILTIDAGFFDQKNYQAFEKLGIFYISGARITQGVRDAVSDLPDSVFKTLKKAKQVWRSAGLTFSYETWTESRPFIFCQPLYENDQMLLPFDRKDSLIVTDICPDTITADMPAEVRRLVDDTEIIRLHHGRGASELVFRAMKDFGPEKLPFKRFFPNAAFFYTMLVAFFLFEVFKQDALSPIIPAVSYAQTVRRKFLDTAAKIVSHSGTVTLRFGKAAFQRLKLKEIWEACQSAPPILA